MKHAYRKWARTAAAGVAAAVLPLIIPSTAAAQADPNPGALTLTAGIDFPSVYVFRGIVQESDPGLTMFPYGDLGWALTSGDGAVKSVTLNLGVWNSLQTGSSGSDGPSGRIHYEEDFYGGATFGFGSGFAVTTSFIAYTSPNNMFNSVTEIDFKVSKAGRFNPYGLMAFEFGGDDAGQADVGEEKGTYAELGAAPVFGLGGSRLTLTVPVKVGLSLGNYYELGGEDHAFGFFDVGGLVTYPLTSSQNRFGAWNVHGSVEFYSFGETTKAFNAGESTKIVTLFGVGFAY